MSALSFYNAFPDVEKYVRSVKVRNSISKAGQSFRSKRDAYYNGILIRLFNNFKEYWQEAVSETPDMNKLTELAQKVRKRYDHLDRFVERNTKQWKDIPLHQRLSKPYTSQHFHEDMFVANQLEISINQFVVDVIKQFNEKRLKDSQTAIAKTVMPWPISIINSLRYCFNLSSFFTSFAWLQEKDKIVGLPQNALVSPPSLKVMFNPEYVASGKSSEAHLSVVPALLSVEPNPETATTREPDSGVTRPVSVMQKFGTCVELSSATPIPKNWHYYRTTCRFPHMPSPKSNAELKIV